MNKKEYTVEELKQLLKDIEQLPENHMNYDGIIGTWRYGHILIAKAEHPDEEDTYELVELYLDENGEPHSWGMPFLGTVEALRKALKDAENHPPVTRFYDEGTFEWDMEAGRWNWTKND